MKDVRDGAHIIIDLVIESRDSIIGFNDIATTARDDLHCDPPGLKQVSSEALRFRSERLKSRSC